MTGVLVYIKLFLFYPLTYSFSTPPSPFASNHLIPDCLTVSYVYSISQFQLFIWSHLMFRLREKFKSWSCFYGNTIQSNGNTLDVMFIILYMFPQNSTWYIWYCWKLRCGFEQCLAAQYEFVMTGTPAGQWGLKGEKFMVGIFLTRRRHTAFWKNVWNFRNILISVQNTVAVL